MGDLLTYLCEPRPWVKQIIAIAHEAKTFDLHFILSRAALLKWRPKLVMRGQKIILMKVEHIKFIVSIVFVFPAPQVIRCIRSDSSEIVVPSLH